MMTATRSSKSTRESILRAANVVLMDLGPAGLTLSAVAHSAGISKGGLLHHFGTKDALVTGMIEDALDSFEGDVEKQAQRESSETSNWLRAFVNVTFAAKPEHDPSLSILAAAAVNPDLLEPVGRYFDRWQRLAAADCDDPVTATTVRLAADGLWFADMFTLSAPAGEERESLRLRLLEMISSANRRGE
jgi:AcrR family transcriptional regulator